jgi:hypothetical protein
MGALEAAGTVGAAASAVAASQSAAPAPTHPLQVTWQPLGDSVSGYLVYFGRTTESANVLVSDLSTDAGPFDPSAPAVTYDAARELGLYPGDTACFRIHAYDVAHVLLDQSTFVCTVA